MSIKHRVLINDHGTFTLFGMNVSLPAMLDLTEEQINYINNTGLYKISELSDQQKRKAKPTSLSVVDGDRFEHSRSISVNELSFKTPIMATKFKEKAKNSLIVKKNSVLLRDKDAKKEVIQNKKNDIKISNNEPSNNEISNNTKNTNNTNNDVKLNHHINNNTVDKIKEEKEKKSTFEPSMLTTNNSVINSSNNTNINDEKNKKKENK